jgi:hypothetical protein
VHPDAAVRRRFDATLDVEGHLDPFLQNALLPEATLVVVRSELLDVQALTSVLSSGR